VVYYVCSTVHHTLTEIGAREKIEGSVGTDGWMHRVPYAASAPQDSSMGESGPWLVNARNLIGELWRAAMVVW